MTEGLTFLCVRVCDATGPRLFSACDGHLCGGGGQRKPGGVEAVDRVGNFQSEVSGARVGGVVGHAEVDGIDVEEPIDLDVAEGAFAFDKPEVDALA